MSCVMCHVSHVTCQVLRVICQVSSVICKKRNIFGGKVRGGGGSDINGATLSGLHMFHTCPFPFFKYVKMPWNISSFVLRMEAMMEEEIAKW